MEYIESHMKRLQIIQKRLGLEPDDIIGDKTLTALEDLLDKWDLAVEALPDLPRIVATVAAGRPPRSPGNDQEAYISAEDGGE